MHLLEVENLNLSFGGLSVIDDLSFTVDEGAIFALIGPNGAGKTSVFNCLTGFYRPNKAKMAFEGRSIFKKKPHVITRMGMARTFQNLRLFRNMSVLDNVKSGQHCRTKAGPIRSILKVPSQKREEEEIDRFSRQCLDFVGISHLADRRASNLPYGDQRRIEWARALATRPKLLLFDEPAAGLNYDEKERLISLIRRIRDELEVTILLIEHDMGLVMKVSEHIVVIDYGKKLAEGDAQTVQNNPRVIEAYLGREEEDEEEEDERS
jgi:branched-chain amino acid transport system ATP-binding protein